jgi:hypothetical protein
MDVHEDVSRVHLAGDRAQSCMCSPMSLTSPSRFARPAFIPQERAHS